TSTLELQLRWSASDMDITAKQIVDNIRALAAEEPDFVYADQPERADLPVGAYCSYLGAQVDAPGGVGCIVGQALSRAGVSEDWLREHEGVGAYGVLHYIDNSIPKSVLYWVSEVHGAQDTGATRAQAVAAADTESPLAPDTFL